MMGAMKENPRYNVVSIRVSDDELEALQEVSKETRKSISEIMREAMMLIQSRGKNRVVRCLAS
jgi:predicted transcriptional regulator